MTCESRNVKCVHIQEFNLKFALMITTTAEQTQISINMEIRIKIVASSPLRLTVEQGTGRMNIDHLTVYESPVTFLRIFLSCVPEEA